MKIGVLMGGISSEREVSLKSGKEIVNNLDSDKYDIIPIQIDKKEDIFTKVKDIDCAFLAFHGEFGEDGKVQAILENMNIPYTGCGVFTSALCMNKKQTKRVLKAENILVPPGYIAIEGKEINYDEIENFGYPLVVKPNNGGSSIGTFLVNNINQLKESIIKAFKFDKEVLIEKYLKGMEYTVPVLNGEVLPILSIRATGEFFDFESKYNVGGAEEIVADIDDKLKFEMQEIAKKCWDILECKAYVRVDIIVTEGVAYVLELNTLPGMTKQSLFPKSANAIGMSYSELLDKIIQYSL